MNNVIDQFHTLTDIEISAALDIMKAGSENDHMMGQAYIMAINRCGQILEIIFKEET